MTYAEETSQKIVGKTIAKAEITGHGVDLTFTDGTMLDYCASDGGYSSWSVRKSATKREHLWRAGEAEVSFRSPVPDGAETLADIVNEIRARAGAWPDEKLKQYDLRLADRIEEAARREADSIERIVRDAIIDYSEQYANAPNDDVERELVERAKRGNAWLVAHGYEPEKTIWDKEESPCL